MKIQIANNNKVDPRTGIKQELEHKVKKSKLFVILSAFLDGFCIFTKFVFAFVFYAKYDKRTKPIEDAMESEANSIILRLFWVAVC